MTDENGKLVWDSGKKISDQSVLISYEGEALTGETFYTVEVTVADNHGNVESMEGSFETGIFDQTEFKAQMITSDFPEDETACPVFGKTFAIDKKVKKARLYATAHGVYEVTLNGQTVGDYRMAPGWTSYHNRLQYQIYDVTEPLAAENEIAITVGNGWYKGILGFYCQPNQYGTQAGAFAELHVEYEDGSKDVIATDETWSVKTGEIRYSEIYMGETIDTDAPEIIEGNVVVKDFDKEVLTAQENEPVRITEKIVGKELIVTPKGDKLVDFGQIVTGVVEVHVKGKKGQKIMIRHAEVLDKDGNFYPETLRQAKSIDTFICNGEEQIFRPHFTFHGFRYISVEGMEEFTADQFFACVTHSDMEKTGRIVSETQTGAIISLYFNLAREKDRKRILNTLLTNIGNHKNHLATGFVGTPYICHTLSENGAHEMAAILFMKEDYPSWLYAVNMGATTIWERWNSIKPDGTFDESGMNSLNHYAYGSVGDWTYRKVAGLSQLEPGYKRFQVKPMFVKGIEAWGTEFESVYGKIVANTSCKNGKIHVHVEVPANTTAVIVLPEKEEVHEVGSGVYDYEYDTKTCLAVERFSMDSTLGEIVAEPFAVEMFHQMAPGMLEGPMIQFAYGMTLAELLGAAPEAKPMYEAVINALNQKEQEKGND